MKVAGLDLDFVNLRSETYTEHSRIPQIDIGTPEQDALRRDFTINSLFYNLNEGMVEDFTKQGLEDLRAGVIQTPMEPKKTFLDGTGGICSAGQQWRKNDSGSWRHKRHRRRKCHGT